MTTTQHTFGSNAWLISYDIADPDRLNRVYRRLRRHCLRVQYSVYLTRKTPEQLDSLLADLNELIDPAEDDIRCYRIRERAELVVLGQPWNPEGVDLLPDD